MNGIILAAGRGSRLKSLTDKHPKCLTVLAGKTLLDWQVSALTAGGVGPIGIVCGYLAAMLRDLGYTCFFNGLWEKTNMVMSLVAADMWLKERTCIVSYSDIVYHPDVIRKLCSEEGDLVITYDRLWYSLWMDRFEDPLNDAESIKVDDDGYLISIGQRPKSIAEIPGQYMGLLKFNPSAWKPMCEVLNRLPDDQRDAIDMTGILNVLLKNGVQIKTVAVDGRWCEVDSERDLILYEKRICSDEPWMHDWRV